MQIGSIEPTAFIPSKASLFGLNSREVKSELSRKDQLEVNRRRGINEETSSIRFVQAPITTTRKVYARVSKLSKIRKIQV